MKTLIIFSLILLSGCASSNPKVDGMKLRIWSYVPLASRVEYANMDQQLIPGLVQNGRRKYSIDELYRWNRLRLIIAHDSEYTCQQMFTGTKLAEIHMEQIFNKLYDNEFDEYAKLVSKAMVKGINNDNTPSLPTINELEEALGSIIISRPDEDLSKLKFNILEAERLSPSEMCWTFKTMSIYAEQNRNRHGDVLVKYLAAM